MKNMTALLVIQGNVFPYLFNYKSSNFNTHIGFLSHPSHDQSHCLFEGAPPRTAGCLLKLHLFWCQETKWQLPSCVMAPKWRLVTFSHIFNLNIKKCCAKKKSNFFSIKRTASPTSDNVCHLSRKLSYTGVEVWSPVSETHCRQSLQK